MYNLVLLALAITLTLFFCSGEAAYDRECQARGGHVFTKYTGNYYRVRFCVSKDGRILDE